jgi:hypothetical protein
LLLTQGAGNVGAVAKRLAELKLDIKAMKATAEDNNGL